VATIFIAAGGTGGHVMPALPVARELATRGHRCIFIGIPTGAEARLVPAAGFPLEYISVSGLQRKTMGERLRSLAQLPLAVMSARGLINKYRPAALLSLGGYVAGPTVLAAISKGIPVTVVEPNAIPGLVTRWTRNYVARACVNFEATRGWFPPGRATVTGVPVRQAFFDIQPKASGPLTVLITGGSQGSRTLNRAARESWPLWQAWQQRTGQRVKLLLQCGPGEAEHLRQMFSETNLDGNVAAFITDFPAAFTGADIVVSRAGASTIAELCAAQKPSILVPLPFAADDHQRHNAEVLVKAGAALLRTDSEWNGQAMVSEITRLAGEPETLVRMGQAARTLARPDAAEATADILSETLKNH
jgi:UDP-N-acetylglucosamine--N-acetylmuramyl-(pentapeptide) pyrophosphoryl-undecaprenol N-acetylglucosamine transferase